METSVPTNFPDNHKNPIEPASRTPYTARQAPVAQLDRALPSEGRGQRFESSRVRHEYSTIQTVCGSLVLGLSANKQHWTRNNADKLLFFVKILHGRCWLVFDLARRRCLSQDRLSPFWEQGLISIRQCSRGVGQCERASSKVKSSGRHIVPKILDLQNARTKIGR